MTITSKTFQQRRQQLSQKLGQGTAIVRSAQMAVMHNDVEYPFRQDSDFYYLTGFNEPEAVAVLAPHHPEHQFVLFVQPKEREKEIWTGYRTGMEGAKERYGADEAFPIAELAEKLPEYIKDADCIYYRPGSDESFNHRIYRFWQAQLRQYPRRGRGPTMLADLSSILHSLRCVKTPAELQLMREAARIATEAHNLAREAAQSGKYEYEIEALIHNHFRQNGAIGPAYPSIVASGANACILHYIDNSRQMQAGDLLLIDAGCCYDYYNSDITRTFPINGKFSPAQKTIYELVLAAQEAAIAEVKPGNTYNQPHDTAVRTITEGLVDLGLLVPEADEDIDQLIEEEKYKAFYMHRTGHWLGIDVHDVGIYKVGEEDWQTFQPGMVLTVEPGIYISPDREVEALAHVGDEWRGIGVRIEDDVLVTESGCEVLSAATPKAVDDLES
ncbi:aminopeptidase P N-terminal domain-containing protein [Synechococcus sp. PCC 7336]|uniref:aminopeptidase P N-terminal domain-containing protein n=1 Tax=Synechococcus sp. PCC 7336 TaxID=195250 RepID=UPI0003480B8D|nr:aminopeptidase P N-terminal domain-containing protein [Synechococcus sp. PCC 7336]